MTIQQCFMRFQSCNNMGWFTPKDSEQQEEDGEIRNMTVEMRQKLGDLECEEAILKDKERFGRVRASLMGFLRAKHGRNSADRALSRVNKRLQENYFTQERHFLFFYFIFLLKISKG